MVVVLVVAVGLAALRSGSENWAGAMFLLTCGILAIAVVGSVFSRLRTRVWWLGFASFGLAYLVLAFDYPPFFYDAPVLPTDSLLGIVQPYLGPGPGWVRGAHENPYLETGQCLLCLLAGLVGGTLAQAVFHGRQVDSHWVTSGKVRRRFGPVVLGTVALLVLAAVTVAGARKEPGLWAGATILFVWGSLGLTAVGAVFGQPHRRAACLGATFFGTGYMLLVAGLPFMLLTDVYRQVWPQFTMNRLLNGLRPWLPTIVSEYPAGSEGIAFANARILRTLDQSIPMRFPQGKPLKDVLKYVVSETRGRDGRELPVYLDPDSVEDQKKTLETSVEMDLDEVPLRTTLDLALGQASLSYTVKGGVLLLASAFDGPDHIPTATSDPYLAIGHSLLALLAAGLGGVLASFLFGPRRGEANVVASRLIGQDVQARIWPDGDRQ